jgi:site-specific DNA-adenine methylase
MERDIEINGNFVTIMYYTISTNIKCNCRGKINQTYERYIISNEKLLENLKSPDNVLIDIAIISLNKMEMVEVFNNENGHKYKIII